MRALYMIVLVFVISSSVLADQNDPRLNALFSRLSETDEFETLHQIEAEIWTIWTASGHTDVDSLMDAGINAMRRQKYDLALEKFNEVVSLLPEFAEGWNKRATLYYLRDELSASMQDVQRTLALEPRHFGALSGMGLIFMQRGDDEGAIKAFEEVLKVHPKSPSAQVHIDRLKTLIRDQVI